MLTQSAIMDQLRRDRAKTTEEGWTRAEYAEFMGYSQSYARHKILEGVRAGRIEVAGVRRHFDMHHHPIRIPTYRFTDASQTRPAPNR